MSVASPLKQKLRVALIQLSAGFDKLKNLENYQNYIKKAIDEAKLKVDLIVLPECFNSPYSVDQFKNYSERIPDGETYRFLSNIAKKYKIFLVGGSIPELDPENNKIYNTSLTFNPQGELIGKHRKAHLFDIDIPGSITFKESITLSAGEKASVFGLEGFGNVGLGICYDIRFPELSFIAARAPNNSFAMIYPGAFNTSTGPLHWHLLARSRAVDNQIYTIVCSPSRDLNSSYHAYGHSLVVDPMGNIVAEAGEADEIIYAELDPELISKARQGIPVNYQRRFDIYKNVADDAISSDK